MALNGQNKLTPVLVIAALCVVGFVLYKAFGKSDAPAAAKPLDKPPVPAADPRNGKSADADSPAETLKTLTSEVKDLKRETQRITDENTQLKNDNNRLQANENAIVDRVRSSLREELSREINNSRSGQTAAANGTTDAASTVVESIMGGADSVRTLSKGVVSPGSDIPAGLGYDNKGSSSSSSTSAVPAAGKPAGSTAGGYRMIVPIGMKKAEGASGQSGLVKTRATTNTAATGDVNSWLATGEAPGASGASRNASAADTGDKQKDDVPYFTIPENATLANVTAMTAIVGRIPVDGKVQDPMQFKLLIGRDNLAANGQEIPDDIAGIVVSGIGIGDMTLSCSEGAIQSLTFIFNDGTIRTVSLRSNGGMLQGGGSAGGKQSISASSKLGYISDAYGNPCIAGRFVTNAPSYLTDVIGLKSLTVAASSFAAAQTSTVNSGLGMSSGVTGNKGSYALGQAVGGAADEVTSWIMRRMNNSFDAVVTPAGARLVVHIDQEIRLDKALNGRKLDYGNLNGPATASSRKRTTRYGLD